MNPCSAEPTKYPKFLFGLYASIPFFPSGRVADIVDLETIHGVSIYLNPASF